MTGKKTAEEKQKEEEMKKRIKSIETKIKKMKKERDKVTKKTWDEINKRFEEICKIIISNFPEEVDRTSFLEGLLLFLLLRMQLNGYNITGLLRWLEWRIVNPFFNKPSEKMVDDIIMGINERLKYKGDDTNPTFVV